MILQRHTILISILLSAGLLTQSVLPAFAVTAATSSKNLGTTALIQDMNRTVTQASRGATVSQTRLSEIITKADTMVTTRVTTLQNILSRIQNDQGLSIDEKTSLSTDIQTQITGLQTLKTKIDADTDATTALADSKTIITNYYVYVVYQPKTQLLITLNNLMTVTTNIQKMVPQLQNLITTYGTGKDTTKLQGLLSDITNQLSTMNTTLTNDITTVQGVSIASQPTAKTTFTQVRKDITTTYKTELTKIRSDIELMRPLIKALFISTAGTSASSSAKTTMSVPVAAPSSGSAQTVISPAASQ